MAVVADVRRVAERRPSHELRRLVEVDARADVVVYQGANAGQLLPLAPCPTGQYQAMADWRPVGLFPQFNDSAWLEAACAPI